MPIDKFPMEVTGPYVNKHGPREGCFCPEEYFKCPKLVASVSKIEICLDWKDQVRLIQFEIMHDGITKALQRFKLNNTFEPALAEPTTLF